MFVNTNIIAIFKRSSGSFYIPNTLVIGYTAYQGKIHYKNILRLNFKGKRKFDLLFTKYIYTKYDIYSATIDKNYIAFTFKINRILISFDLFILLIN